MSLSHLTNFVAVDERVGTAGQPTAGQIVEIKSAGYEAVVNLAMGDSEKALPNEADLVAQQGMDYAHIPVVWDAPQKADFVRFAEVMNANADRRVFVHCAMNMRASAFTFLYRIIHQGVEPSEAKAAMQQVWDPQGVWEAFVVEVLADHGVDYYDID